MPPVPPSGRPRLIVYYQTHHSPSNGAPISVLPLVNQPNIDLTHLMLAAIHINEDPHKLTLNDHAPSHPRFQTLWAEMRVLQASGVKVMGMLGGAAKGSFTRLDGSQDQFERYYGPLHALIKERHLDGMDLDVEEDMSLNGIIRLIDRLRADFGPSFIITLAPVATALVDFTKNISGFDYEELEVMRGKDIAWYNTQWYCGWGDFSNPILFEWMVFKGWPIDKLVVGLVTSPANGSGFISMDLVGQSLTLLTARYGGFGGVMGWEYFNSSPGGEARPWEWAQGMTQLMRKHSTATAKKEVVEIDGSWHPHVPKDFEYYSDDSDADR